MAPFDRRDFSGNSVPTTITGNIGPGDLTINIASATGWPDGDVGPFIVTIDKGLATEEKIEVLSRTALALTITPTGRGHDNTAAVGHTAGASIEHTLAARDLQEANQHIADDTLDHHSQYLNPTRHAAEVHAIDTVEIVDAAVTYVKLAPGQRWEPGDFKWGIQVADHPGWLLCDGRNVAIATYGALWAAMGSAHIFAADPGGGNFKLPDLRKRYLAGKAASGVGSTLGGSFGSADAITVSHSHTVNSHSHGGGTGVDSPDHAHNANHGHTADDNWTGVHKHNVGGATGPDIAFRAGNSSEGLMFNPSGTRATFSWMDDAGGHDHNITVNANNFNTAGATARHTHSVGAESPGTNVIGTAGTDANLPPSIAVNGFIHV